MSFSWPEVPEFAVDLYRELHDEINEAFEKQAFDMLGELGEFLQLFPGKTFGIPSQPGPLASMLVGGLAGAGLGYMGGTLGEQFLPASFSRGNLRRTAALAGAGMGMVPGLTWGLANRANNQPFFSYQEGTAPALPSEAFRTDFNKVFPPSEQLDSIPKFTELTKASRDKLAELLPGDGLGIPPINVNRFNHMVWNDPRVADQLDPREQAAASGLMQAADSFNGRRSNGYVTPMDIGRLAAGMGAGYSSGALVGKVLGIALGMPASWQDQLKDVGVMAGLIKTYIPMAFGG